MIRLSSKWVWASIVVFVLCYTVYQLKWGYETFEIEDATQPTHFVYQRWLDKKNYNVIRLRIRGNLVGGQGVINVYYCDKANKYGTKVMKVQLRGDGDIDTIGTNDFYTSRACIEYKTRGVKKGKLSVSISIG